MTYPNAQALVTRYLEGVTGITATTRIPETRPKRFIQVTRIGGFERDPITDVARLRFRCWNTVKTEAERDAQLARATIKRLRGDTVNGHKVHRVHEITALLDAPDLDSGVPIYEFTLEVHIRKERRGSHNGS